MLSRRLFSILGQQSSMIAQNVVMSICTSGQHNWDQLMKDQLYFMNAHFVPSDSNKTIECLYFIKLLFSSGRSSWGFLLFFSWEWVWRCFWGFLGLLSLLLETHLVLQWILIISSERLLVLDDLFINWRLIAVCRLKRLLCW